jgi:HSP20 family protein
MGQLSSVREEINRLFDTTFGASPASTDFFSGWVPALDLYEDKDNLVLRLEVPGMRREEIDISFQDGLLTISGERKAEERPEVLETYRSERFTGRFHRSLELPKPVQSDKAFAVYRDGVLTVTLPKTDEARPKQIEVKVD